MFQWAIDLISCPTMRGASQLDLCTTQYHGKRCLSQFSLPHSIGSKPARLYKKTFLISVNAVISLHTRTLPLYMDDSVPLVLPNYSNCLLYLLRLFLSECQDSRLPRYLQLSVDPSRVMADKKKTMPAMCLSPGSVNPRAARDDWWPMMSRVRLHNQLPTPSQFSRYLHRLHP